MANATIKKNVERNGIEIAFKEKPARETLDTLKVHKFRWNPQTKVWYTKYTPEALEVAKAIVSNKCAPKVNGLTVADLKRMLNPSSITPKVKDSDVVIGFSCDCAEGNALHIFIK